MPVRIHGLPNPQTHEASTLATALRTQVAPDRKDSPGDGRPAPRPPAWLPRNRRTLAPPPPPADGRAATGRRRTDNRRCALAPDATQRRDGFHHVLAPWADRKT